MSRTLCVLVVCLGVAFIGAAPPQHTKPSPTPSPSPAATLPPHSALPIVVVFPFDASSDIKAGTGVAAAQLFTQQMNADGGVDAIDAPTSVKRANYATYAKSVNADYYVTGYMTPLGTGVSLVEQVVSTSSGTIVYGQTAQIESFQDATAQATLIHDGILQLEKQLADAYTSAQAQATSTPSSTGNRADLTKPISGLAGLFHHQAKATPAPASAKPAKGVLVVRVNGALPQSDLGKATDELYSSLNAHYNARLTRAAPANVSAAADGICGRDRDNTIASGVASATVVHHGLGSRAEYTFVLNVYTCFGAVLAQSTGTGTSIAAAVNSAVSNYASAHPLNG